MSDNYSQPTQLALQVLDGCCSLLTSSSPSHTCQEGSYQQQCNATPGVLHQGVATASKTGPVLFICLLSVWQEAVQHRGNNLWHSAHSVGLFQHRHKETGKENKPGEASTIRETEIASPLTSTVKSSDVTNVRSCLISKTLDQIKDKLEITTIPCHCKTVPESVWRVNIFPSFWIRHNSMQQRCFQTGTKIKEIKTFLQYNKEKTFE